MILTRPQPQVLISGLHFPEGPRWARQRAWCVDGPRVWSVGSDGAPRVEAELPCPLVLGIQVFDDHLLVARVHERRLARVDAHGLTEVADLSTVFDRPINEFVRHPNGHLYVGHMGFDPMKGEAPCPSRMAHIDPAGSITLEGPPLLFANGIVVDPQDGALLVVESFAARLTRIPVRADGRLSDDGHLVADLNAVDARPDGLCRDRHGHLWVADMAQGSILHLAPDGTPLERLMLPWPHVTSCAIDDQTQRLCFTATSHLPDAALSRIGDGVLGVIDLTAAR